MFSLSDVSQIKIVCALWFITVVYAFFFDRFVAKKLSSPVYVISAFIVGIVCIVFVVFIALGFVVFL